MMFPGKAPEVSAIFQASDLPKLQSRPIEMRDAVSQPSLDIEESYFNKFSLFFGKNHFIFYHLKL